MERLKSAPELFDRYKKEAELNERLNPGGLRFTDDERDSFYQALRKYRDLQESTEQIKPDVEEFISHLEISCGIAIDLMGNPKRSELVKDKKAMLKRWKKTLKDLKAIRGRKFPFDFQDSVIPLRDEEIESLHYSRRKKAALAAEHLEDLLNTIKDDPRDSAKAGRDRFNKHDFVKTIAGFYSTYIDNPSGYKGGPFYEVVCIALETVGLPSKDPSKTIKPVLSELSPRQ